MIESVLVIDATRAAAFAVVADSDGVRSDVVARHRFTFDVDAILRRYSSETGGADGREAGPSGGTEGAPGDGPAEDEGPDPAAALADALSEIRHPYSGSVLVLPGRDYVSLNLTLPFKDQKTLSKVIGPELQDTLPFEVSDFVVSNKIVGDIGEGLSDVHVSALPKADVAAVLAVCRAAGFEPNVVCTPDAAVVGLLDVFAREESGDVLVIVPRAPRYHLVAVVDGRLASARQVFHDDPGSGLATDVRLFKAGVEKRYGRRLDQVAVLGDDAFAAAAARAAGSKSLKISDEEGEALAVLATSLGREGAARGAFCNFRVGEFSHNPYLKRVVRGATRAAPYLASLVTTAAVVCAVVFAYRERLVTVVQAEVSARIREAVPSLSAPPGRELAALQGARSALDKQLRELGSSTRSKPLDALLELSRDIPPSSDVTVRKVSVDASNVLTVEGTAPDYSAVERLERVFKTKKSVYCRIRKTGGTGSAGSGDRRTFGFELRLCE